MGKAPRDEVRVPLDERKADMISEIAKELYGLTRTQYMRKIMTQNINEHLPKLIDIKRLNKEYDEI